MPIFVKSYKNKTCEVVKYTFLHINEVKSFFPWLTSIYCDSLDNYTIINNKSYEKFKIKTRKHFIDVFVIRPL